MNRGDLNAADHVALRHQANYVLERGVWRVSCRVCDWHAEGLVRRQLASRFRFHLRCSSDHPASDALSERQTVT